MTDNLAIAILQAAVTSVAIPLAIVTLLYLKRDELIKIVNDEYIQNKEQWIKSNDLQEMISIRKKMELLRNTYFFNWFYVFVPTILLFLSIVASVRYLEAHEFFWEVLIEVPFLLGISILILPAATMVFILTFDSKKEMENQLFLEVKKLEHDLIQKHHSSKHSIPPTL